MNAFDRAQQEQALEAMKKKPRDNGKVAQLTISLRPVVLEQWGLSPAATPEEILAMVFSLNQDRFFHNADVHVVVDGKSEGHIKLRTTYLPPASVETPSGKPILFTEKESHEQRQAEREKQSQTKDWRTHCAHGLERGTCAA